MIASTNSLVFTPDIEALQLQLESLNSQMEVLAKAGKYVLAENHKLNAEKLKKDIDSKRLEMAQKRQCKENREVKKYLKDDLTTFNAEWDNKFKEQEELGKNLVAGLKAKHKNEEAEQRVRLGEECFRGKESSQLLNLRVVELNLAKQLNFVEAQLVQKEVKDLEKKEQEKWQKLKQQRTDKEIEALKARQMVELRGLEKKIASTKWELEIERTKAEAKLVLKHSVVVKELQGENKKEALTLKGEFKSKCPVYSPGRSVLSPSKSRILSSTSQNNFTPTTTR